MDNILALHEDLKNKTYEHGSYEHFTVNDPKPRDIHKASVRDRIVHRAIYRILYPFFDTLFIADSYSCRIGKGTHRAIRRFEVFARKASRNRTKSVWVLKCDIRKFFASIDHGILLDILRKRIPDPDILWLLGEVVGSFHVSCHPATWNSGILDCHAPLAMTEKRGLPLGNLTSQLFANVYLNEFDQFVKHGLKAKRYIRYADDFVLFSTEYEELEGRLISIKEFLEERLQLNLHPDKVSIKTLASGVDFLGWIHFPDHRVLRTATKKRMFRKLGEKNVSSYPGLLWAGNGYRLQERIGSLCADRSRIGK